MSGFFDKVKAKCMSTCIGTHEGVGGGIPIFSPSSNKNERAECKFKIAITKQDRDETGEQATEDQDVWLIGEGGRALEECSSSNVRPSIIGDVMICICFHDPTAHVPFLNINVI